MATIVTRSGKGSALTHTEMDANFTNLNNDKPDVIGTPTTNNVVTWDTNDDAQDGGYSFPNCNAAVNPSDEELNYSVGVTSLIQTQLDARLFASNNLSDVASSYTSRANLELDSISSELQYLGTGDLGAVTMSTDTTLDSGEYHYSSLTLNVSQTLDVTEATAGWLILRCTGTVTIAGTIDLIGKGAAGAATGGGTGSIGTGGATGGAGGAATPNDGGDSGASTFRAITVDGITGPTGANANGSNGTATDAQFIRALNYVLTPASYGGSGGGGGAVDTSTGGVGGNGGGYLVIIADTIDFQTGAALSCTGGVGTVTHNNDGGGGGGGGGTLILASNTLTNDGTINVAGGAGGGAPSTGGNGGAGGAGYSLVVTL